MTAPPPAQPSNRSGGIRPSGSLIDVLSADRGRSGAAPPSGTAHTKQQPLLTARVVAELLGVCTETVLRWIRNGELPAIHLPGGAVRIPQNELNDWLRSRATPRRGVLATRSGAAEVGRYPKGYDGDARYHGPPTSDGSEDEED